MQTTTKLSPREEDQIIREFRAAYSLLATGGWASVDPNRTEQDRVRKLQALQSWLQELATKFGRMISEEEAFSWYY